MVTLPSIAFFPAKRKGRRPVWEKLDTGSRQNAPMGKVYRECLENRRVSWYGNTNLRGDRPGRPHLRPGGSAGAGACWKGKDRRRPRRPAGEDMVLKKLRRCAVYLAAIGAVFFYVGRLLPGNWFRGDRFPFRCFAFERGGRIYERLGIRRWKDKVPDMSRLLPRVMLPKRLTWGAEPERVARMIQETCIAELVHVVLFVLGFGCVLIWDGPGGWITAVVYNLLGNVPFILIQRYNRPRLLHLMKTMSAAAEREEAVCVS